MKKLISMTMALALCLSLAGSFAAADTSAERSAAALSAMAAEDDSVLDDVLPKKYRAMKTFIEENGTVSVQGDYLVFCGNICDYAVMKMKNIDVHQVGDGKFEEVRSYQITDDGYDDGSGNVVIVYKPVKPGDVNISVTCADSGMDGGRIQCLIDRKCTIGDDLSITLKKAPSMENLLYSAYMDGYRIVKAHEQISGDLNIPEKFGNVPVTAIPEEFLKYYSNVTSVTLPATISAIPLSAFKLCYDMKTITIKNPKCIISSSPKTITNTFPDEFNGTILGYKGSTAEKYAEKNDYNFKAIESDIDDILPKSEYEATKFLDEYGAVSVHGKYVVVYEYFFKFYNHGSQEYKGFDTLQDGDGRLELVRSYDVGNTAYPSAAKIFLVYEAREAGDVEFMSTYNYSAQSSTEVLAHRKLTIAEDMSVTDSGFNGAEHYLLDFKDDDTLSVMPPWGLSELVIPSEIMGKKVTALMEDSCRSDNELVSVVIPETVEWIGPNSFAYCPVLEKVVIENPKCVIAVNENSYDNAICNRCDIDTDWECLYDGVICGYTGSEAEKFAKSRGYRFEALDSNPAANGDINSDGKLSVADVILLQRWLLGAPGTEELDYMAADLCDDGVIDVFDLILMRQKLVEAPAVKDDFIQIFEVYDVDTGKQTDAVTVAFNEYAVVRRDGSNTVDGVVRNIKTTGEPIVFNSNDFVSDGETVLKYDVRALNVTSNDKSTSYELLKDKTETVNGVTRLYVKSTTADEKKFVNTFDVCIVNRDDYPEISLEKAYSIHFNEYVTVKTPDGNASTVNIIKSTAGENPIVIDGTKWSNAVEYRVTAESVECLVNCVNCRLLTDKTETVDGVTKLYIEFYDI